MFPRESSSPGQGRGRSHLARNLRKQQTPREAKLWSRLRAHQFHGFQFKQQVPIGPYIVDFSCRARKLIIELDGSQHAESEVQKYGQARDAFLRNEGYRLVRFWNNEVDTNLHGVLERIFEELSRPLF